MDSAHIITIAKKTLSQVLENKSYQMNLNQLKNKITAAATMQGSALSTELLLCLALISLIEENYDLSPITAKLNINKEAKSEVTYNIEKIAYMIQMDSYPNIYLLLRAIDFNSELFKILKDCYYHIYLLKQAVYLSKFYSKIKVKTLEKYLGNEMTPEYLNRFNWVKKDDYVITAPIKEPFNILRLMKDLEFIGKMNIAFERITQSNLLI